MKIWKVDLDLWKIGSLFYQNIANIISLARIACSPIVVIMMVSAFYQFLFYGKTIWPDNYSNFAFNLFVACEISDALDGLLARLLKIKSDIGGFLDRVGDKTLILPVFGLMLLFYIIIAFKLFSLLAFPVSGLLIYSIYLEVMLARYGLKGFKAGASVNSNWSGKTKMVLHCIQATYWMFGFLFPHKILNLYWLNISVYPLATHNLVFTLLLLSTIIAFTLGSIAGYKSLPEYQEMIGMPKKDGVSPNPLEMRTAPPYYETETFADIENRREKVDKKLQKILRRENQ